MTSLTDSIKEKYGAAALHVASGSSEPASCCGTSACCGSTTETWDPITGNLYDEGETAGLPADALLASLGCGNPTALAELGLGETVLDLGSGGGIDVLLSARRVGPTGKCYGLDMTDEMLELANANKQKAGAENVEFLKGEIEDIPLPANSVDVIISNCVINLSGDKQQVISEAFRVLKPGGRFAVSDVVIRGGMPPEVAEHVGLWTGCVAGALEEQEYAALLTRAGFENVSIEPTRIYSAEDAMALMEGTGLDAKRLAAEIDGRIMSAFVRGTKPAGVQLRSAAAADLVRIEALLASSSLPVAEVRNHLDHFVVAEAAGELAGVTGVELWGEYGLLRSAAVHPDWRGRGVGRLLVERAISQARERGLRALYLLTTTAASYFPAFGFVPTSRASVPAALLESVEFRGACPSSATVMRLDLQDRA